MSDCTQILVVLNNADPTALTALGALQRSLGFGERLVDLRRRVLWELHGPPGEDPEELLQALMRGGELWNLNKENASVRRPGQSDSSLGPPAPGEGNWESFLAWNPERDLASVPQALIPFRPRGWRLARGVLWSLCWKDGTADARSTLSLDAVVCTGPKQGLLVHPHLEDYRQVAAGSAPPWLPDPS